MPTTDAKEATMTRLTPSEARAHAVSIIATYLGVHPNYLFVADAGHEGLNNPQAFSIAYEGYGDFAYVAASMLNSATDPITGASLATLTGWFAEAVTECILAVYPERF